MTRNRRFVISVMIISVILTSVMPFYNVGAKTKVKETSKTVSDTEDKKWLRYDVNDCVALNTYSRSQLNSSITSIVKQDIKDYINSVLKEYPSYTKIEKSLVQKDDYVNVDIVGYVDGETDPSIEIENYTVHVGEGVLPEKVENSLVGKMTGQTYNVSCKSTDYNELYGGYDAQFTIKVNDIVYATFYTYDDITEQYAKEKFKVDSLDTFYKKMEAEAAVNLYSYKKDALYKSFSGSTIVIPKGLAAQKYDQAKELLIHQTFGDDRELYTELIPEYTGLRQQDFEKGLYDDIKANLPRELLLLAVARKEGIRADGEGYEAYITNMVARGGFISREKLFDYYKNPYESGEEYLKRQYILYATVNHFCDYTVAEYEEPKYDEVIKDEDIIGCKQYAVPPTTGFKSYMGYKTITSKNTDQYKLQSKAETDYNGIRMVDGRYLVALGTHFGGKIGQYIDLKLDDGTVINCILGDVKADKDTDLNNIVTTHNGCCSEFIVDPKVIPDNVKITGNMSNLYDNWSSPVHSVIVYDRYTEIPTETQ